MTLLGKILVFLNLALSMLLASWAFGVYANRIDWSDNKGDEKKGQPAGELVSRKAELGESGRPGPLWMGLRTAEASWLEARRKLGREEDRIAGDRLWYYAEMEHLRTGATAVNPARAVVFTDGLPAADPKNPYRPQMVGARDQAGKPLRSLAAYGRDLEAIRKDLGTVLARYQEQIEQDMKLTQLLIGPKGLQQRLVDEKVKREDVVKEQGLVRPQLVNAVVESELVLKRRRELEKRIEELRGKAEVAGGR
jgi:hypothetical protein